MHPMRAIAPTTGCEPIERNQNRRGLTAPFSFPLHRTRFTYCNPQTSPDVRLKSKFISPLEARPRVISRTGLTPWVSHTHANSELTRHGPPRACSIAKGFMTDSGLGPEHHPVAHFAAKWHRPEILEAIFDQLSDGLFLYDQSLHVVGVNQAAQRLFGMLSKK
jgi:PAS domain-containing protein